MGRTEECDADSMGDGPWLVIADHDRTGPLFFGPFRSVKQVQRAVQLVERRVPAADWSLETLQAGGALAEWCRVVADRED